MTESPDRPPQVFADVGDAIRGLRASGLRMSTPRRLVLEALFAAEGPVSAAHLSRTLSLDESSVYRNLELLEQRGLIRHLHLGHSPGLYVLVTEDEPEYLYCEHCAKVTAVPPARIDPVRRQIRDRFGYTARFTHFAMIGTCADCATAAAESRRTRQRPSARAAAEKRLHSHGDYVHAHPARGRHDH